MHSFINHRVPGGSPALKVEVIHVTSIVTVALLFAGSVAAQSPAPAADKIIDGYAIHQSIDLGGRVVDYSGSSAMYDTLVNLQSGPRTLSQMLDMRAVAKPRYSFFDTLMTTSTGYGGDPNNVSVLRMSKGKLYDLQGMFRRNRRYFDYNLFDNPLVPDGVTSNGYTFPQVLHSPHLFNTVRRMTDVNLTLFPISKVSIRVGYSQNINQGPSYSSQHNGAEALYLQNWRNSTDSWVGGIDWRALKRTTISFAEYVSHYKGDTSWQLAGLGLQLADGTPVTLGFDNVKPPSCGDGNEPIVSNSTSPATANPTCSGYTHYARSAPMRTLLPTEDFHFQSSSIKNLQMNGRVRYTGGTMKVPNYYERFEGLDNMGIRIFTSTGSAKSERASVSADYGVVWQISDAVSLSEQFDYSNFHQPADSYISQIVETGTSMLIAPDPAQPPAITAAHNYLGMKSAANTFVLAWNASARASVSLGYRYRARTIGFAMPLSTDALPTGTSYSLDLHDSSGLLGISLRPTTQWRINGNFEAQWADKAYTQVSP